MPANLVRRFVGRLFLSLKYKVDYPKEYTPLPPIVPPAPPLLFELFVSQSLNERDIATNV